MINPFHITTFLELCHTRHFTKTAHALNMTQPGVSQHLKALENELGVLLFFRKGKKIELTPAGEQFHKFATAQKEAESALRERLIEDSPHIGDIRLSCSGSMAMLLYPELLNLQKRHCRLSVSLEAAPNERSIQLVKNNDSDIALITCFIDDPDLNIEEVGHEPLCLALPKGQSQDWSNLLKLGYINHPNGAHYATQVFEQNYRGEFTGFRNIPQKGYINQLTQILTPVAKGIGFSVLPESTVDGYADAKSIRKACLRTPCQETIYLVTKKYKPLPRRYHGVLTCLKKIWAS